jgi:hypothetical protein
MYLQTMYYLINFTFVESTKLDLKLEFRFILLYSTFLKALYWWTCFLEAIKQTSCTFLLSVASHMGEIDNVK